jgi:hypothetical protein
MESTRRSVFVVLQRGSNACSIMISHSGNAREKYYNTAVILRGYLREFAHFQAATCLPWLKSSACEHSTLDVNLIEAIAFLTWHLGSLVFSKVALVTNSTYS